MSETKKKKIKATIFILSVAIPFAMLLGFLIPTGKAGPDIPIDPYIDPRNKWHWEIDVDEQLIYELEMEVYDNETGQLIFSSKSIHIFNITSFDNTTYDGTDVSRVNATEYYYDCVSDSLKQIQDPYPLAMFGYNAPRTPREKYYFGEGTFAPFIIPRNGTIQNFTVIANILNETFYDQYQQGITNYFKDVDPNIGDYNISCLGDNDNTVPYRTGDWYTGDFYARIIYNPNDVLINQDTCVLILEQEGTPEARWRLYNYTIRKCDEYDYNITDEIDWYFQEGMTFYVGESNVNESEGSGYPYHDEFKVDIAGFNYSNYEISTIWGEMNMTFQNILINFSIWNESAGIYELQMSNFPAGQANNFYPFHPMIFDHSFPVFMPNTTDLQDLQFMIDYLRPYGVDKWNIEDGDIIEYELEISELASSWHMEFDNETMGALFGYRETEGQIEYLFYQKNYTLDAPIGTVNQRLYTPLEGNNKVWINFTNSGPGDIDLYWGLCPVNPLEPLNYLFYEEIPDLGLYIDVYVDNTTLVENGLVNFTINYDPAPISLAGIPEDNLRVYKFNGTDWVPLNSTDYNVDPSSDTIRINTTGANFFTVGAPEEWNWSTEINVGNELYYETTGKLSGPLSDEMGIVNLPFVDFYILNITNVGLSYKDRGDGKDCWMNQINGSMHYWDPTVKDLVKFEDAGEFVLNEFNLSYSVDPLKPFYFSLTQNNLGFPIVVPLLFNKLHLVSIGEALNDSFYSSPMVRDIGLPSWDEIKVNHLTNTLTFNDTTSDYYIAGTYYDNGTLKEAVGSVEFKFSVDMVKFNITTTRTYDYNQTDDVEWGVQPGDSYYFGSNFPMGGPTLEVNITIVEINETAVFLHDIIFFGDDGNGNGDGGGPPMFQTYLTFSNVWAKIEVWNVTEGENGGIQTGEWLDLEQVADDANTTTIIAAANNYLPFPMGDYYGYKDFNLSGYFVPILMPKGIDGYELAEEYGDLVSLFSLMVFEGDVVPQITEVTEKKLRIEMTAPSEPSFSGFYEWYLDNETGVSKYFHLYAELDGETWIATTFQKNYTFAKYSGPGSQYTTIEFDNYLIPDINATVTIEHLGDIDFFEAVLYENPVNSSMSSTYGNPMFFTDLFIINHTSDSYNLTFKMDLPLRYPVALIQYLAIYEYSPSNPEEARWSYYPLSDLPFGNLIKDAANNNITLEGINLNGTLVTIVAWMFMGPRGGIPVGGGGGGGGGAKEAPIIYGYDIPFLIMAIALFSIVIIIKRRKITEILKK